MGQTANGFKPFTDCRHVEFTVHISDPTIFIVDEGFFLNFYKLKYFKLKKKFFFRYSTNCYKWKRMY